MGGDHVSDVHTLPAYHVRMRITRKRVLRVFAVVAVLVAGAGGGVYMMVGGEGVSPLEAWVGRQVKTTINSYLIPQLEFDEVDYQAPKTVHLTGVHLTAEDPDNPGKTVEIFTAESMTITLGQVPRLGRPLVIETVTLNQPTLRLVTPTGGGPLIGYSKLVQSEPDAEAPPLSEVLQLTLIELRDAAIVLDMRDPGTEPTIFDQISTDLHIDQEAGGLYDLALELDRAPALDATLQAQFDIDALTLQIQQADIALELDRDNDRFLPQSLQTFTSQYDLIGGVTLTTAGLLNLNTWQESALEIDLQLTNANAVIGEYRVVGESLHVVASSADRQVQVRRIEADIFDGNMQGEVTIGLSTGYPFELHLTGTGLVLEKTLAPSPQGLAPRYAGLADFQLTANGPLSDVMTELRGEGTAQVREGRIARIAVISDLIDFMESGGDLTRPEDGTPAGRDRADVAFRLRGNHAYLSQAEIIGSWFAVRGKGKVFFDQSMDVQVNAGPMEKVQDTLGAVGDVFGALTDSLMAYRVSGTAAEPAIRVVAFGGLRGVPGSNEEDLPPWSPPGEPGTGDAEPQATQPEQATPENPRAPGRGDPRATTTTPGRVPNPNADD